MPITGEVLQVEGLAGTLVSVINRGGKPKLVNQKVTNNDSINEDDITEIPLNVVISYDVTLSNTKTANPTQIGINVNDHIYKNPTEITINFGVTDFGGTLARLRGLYDSINSGWRGYNAGNTISQQMLEVLINASNRKTLFTLDDGLHKYENLSIDSINYVRDKKSNKALIATVTLSDFIFVQAGNVDGTSSVVPSAYDKTEYAGAIDKLTNIGAIVGM